jgi:hypothetical protein
MMEVLRKVLRVCGWYCSILGVVWTLFCLASFCWVPAHIVWPALLSGLYFLAVGLGTLKWTVPQPNWPDGCPPAVNA